MKLLAALSCLLTFSGALGDEFYKCYWIASPQIDCVRFEADSTCGTNRVTYANKCEFSKAHCNDDTINVLHYGACTSTDMTTTVPGAGMTTAGPIVGGNTPAPVAGGDVVFDFMCTSLSHKDCPVGGPTVCAIDGKTYASYCEYEKAKCTHRDLHVVACTV